jgi:hypothetical protein
MPEPNHVVVGVHGLSAKPPLEHHQADWISAIREGLSRNFAVDVAPERIAFDLVYWADWLDRPAIVPAQDDEPYVPAAGTGPLPSYQQRWRDVALREGLGLIEHKVDWVKGAPPVEWIRARAGLDEVGWAFLKLRLIDLGTYYSEEVNALICASALPTGWSSTKTSGSCWSRTRWARSSPMMCCAISDANSGG